MPFKTEHGTHYHMRSGCSGATIACDTAGLSPCSRCCGEGLGTPTGTPSEASVPSGAPDYSAAEALIDEETESRTGPAIFTREFTTPDSEGVYAVRISKHPETGAEAVSSKGTDVGYIPETDEATHMRSLSSILEMTSSADMMAYHSMPSYDSVSEDEIRSIYFDMDGTLADLYSVPDWLPKLRSSDPTPYEDAVPLVDMGELNDAIRRLQGAGWHVGVVSWLAKVSDDGYSRAVSASKRLWLMRNLPTLDEINLVSYGVAKQTAIANKRNAVLVDDESQNLEAWQDDRAGRTVIDASDPMEMLRQVQALSYAS